MSGGCARNAATVEPDFDENFLLRCSYIEIYRERIHDLLSEDTVHGFEKKNMKIKCDDPVRGAIIEGLTEVIISNPEDALGLLVDGEENRHVAGTDMNERSSRSHTVFRVIIETKPTEEAEARPQ